ncbi:bifunctional Brix domain/Ribosome biogenesis protein Rpf2 [Babesia duncani]|uniref:Ribosome production factor 2 homolog n=1 Tax=Babesia duncani TaxID=323732 RepID=A0AAD9UPY8_9APIC|nr:bifunctional Brix domain/Ribosome biogenesis protein Rpf2 [Babesia duncani]
MKSLNKSQSKVPEPEEPVGRKNILFLLSRNHLKDAKQLLKDLYGAFKGFGIYRLNKSDEYERQEEELKLTVNEKNHRIASNVCGKLSCGLYVVASSNKKRHISIGIGRLYNGKILDCCQMHGESFVPSAKFLSYAKSVSEFSAHMLVFQGADFGATSGPWRALCDILLDLFRAPRLSKVSLEGLDSVIVVTLTSPAIASSDAVTSDRHLLFRRYFVKLLAPTEGSKCPSVKLEEIGPRADFVIDQVIEPDAQVYRHALAKPKVPKQLKAGLDTHSAKSTDGDVLSKSKRGVKRGKNITTDALGNVEGRVYVNRESLDNLYTPLAKLQKRNR